MTRASALYAVAAAVYLAVVGYITLAAVPWQTAPNESAKGVLSARTWADPTTWVTGSGVEFGANVLMFVPVGLLLCLAFSRVAAPVVTVGAVGIAAAIEIVQIPLDRVSDPRDLVANSVGALLGVLVGSVARRFRVAAAERAIRGEHEGRRQYVAD
jgi:glycopeptide antibiotics resistance protein